MVTRNNLAVSEFAPFFTAELQFRQPILETTGGYNCIVCGDDIGQPHEQPLAISYATNYLGTWAHPVCLKKAKQTIRDDKRAKNAAKMVHKAAFDAEQAARRQQKATTTTTVSSTPHKTTVKTHTTQPTDPDLGTTSIAEGFMKAQTELRATIEQEYENLMQQALATIQGLQARVAVLESDNEKLAMELSKIMVASVATPAPTTLKTGRCGAPRKDGTACRWDTSKTACMHHNRAA